MVLKKLWYLCNSIFTAFLIKNLFYQKELLASRCFLILLGFSSLLQGNCFLTAPCPLLYFLSQHYNNLEVLIIFHFLFNFKHIPYTMCMKIRLLQFLTNIACTVFSIVHIFIICWYPNLLFICIFSSPEHEVLMVSYCGQWVVRRPSLSVVRRESTFDVYTLETTFVIQFLWNFVRMFV